MRIALYNEDSEELETLSELLERCVRGYLRFAEVVPYRKQEDFCTMVRDEPKEFDLYVVAQDGTFSLEVVELLREVRPQARLFWFSDLDFALRAYRYNVDWFGRKPVTLPAMEKAFERFVCRGEKILLEEAL